MKYVICPKCKSVSIEYSEWELIKEYVNFFEIKSFDPYTLKYSTERKSRTSYVMKDMYFIHKKCNFKTGVLYLYEIHLSPDKNITLYGYFWKNKKEEANKIIYEYLKKEQKNG